MRRAPEQGRGVAAARLPRAADLHEEFPVGRELDELVVLGIVAADPDVALGVDVNAVLVLEPLVARARPAPGFLLCAESNPRRSYSSPGGNLLLE